MTPCRRLPPCLSCLRGRILPMGPRSQHTYFRPGALVLAVFARDHCRMTRRSHILRCRVIAAPAFTGHGTLPCPRLTWGSQRTLCTTPCASCTPRHALPCPPCTAKHSGSCTAKHANHSVLRPPCRARTWPRTPCLRCTWSRAGHPWPLPEPPTNQSPMRN
jgi:hypothetical protein